DACREQISARAPHRVRRADRDLGHFRAAAADADGDLADGYERPVERLAAGDSQVKRRAPGFTLIELLIALLVFGIFSALAYAGLGRLLDGRARLADSQRGWQGLSQGVMRVSGHVAHTRPRGVRDEAGIEVIAPLIGRPYDSRALAEPSLELTRGGEMKYRPALESDLRRVAYLLKGGKLYRITWLVLDRPPVPKPLESPLISNVETF